MDKPLEQIIEEILILLKRNDREFIEQVFTYAILLEKGKTFKISAGHYCPAFSFFEYLFKMPSTRSLMAAFLLSGKSQ